MSRSLFASLLTFAFVSPVVAQSPEKLVIHAHQIPTDSARSGVAVSVITAGELQAQGITSLSDALRQIPGLAVNISGPKGSVTQARIRGAEGNHTLVMIDGIIMNALDSGDYNLASLGIDEIERIEVIRGPQSGLYGANAHAGVISILTRSGRGAQKPELDTRMEVGSQRSVLGTASVRAAVGPVYGALNGSYDITRGFDVSRTGSEPDGARASALSGKGGIDFSENFNIEGSFRWIDRKVDSDPSDYNATYPAPLYTAVPAHPLTYGLPVDGVDQTAFTSFAGRVEATATLLDGAWVQKASASLMEEHQTFHDSTGLANSYDGRREQYETRSIVRFQTTGLRHTLVGGVDHQRESFSQFSSYFAFNPGTQELWGKGFSRSQTGLFGEYLADFENGLSLSGAVRHDDFDAFEDALTWRATASYLIAPTQTRLHASMGTGVTKPTFIEQFGFYPSQFRGNAALRPESSLGWDVGITQSLMQDRIIADVTYFQANLKDEIVTRSLGSGLSTLVNAPTRSHRRGIETTLTLKPLDTLTLQGSYTWLDAEEYDAAFSTRLSEIRRPRHAASASATWSFADNRAHASVGVTWNGGMWDRYYGVSTTRVRLAPFTLVTAQLSYDITPQATAYIRAENMLDSGHEEVYGYRAPRVSAYTGLKIRF